jgi:hypothetical protein
MRSGSAFVPTEIFQVRAVMTGAEFKPAVSVFDATAMPSFNLGKTSLAGRTPPCGLRMIVCGLDANDLLDPPFTPSDMNTLGAGVSCLRNSLLCTFPEFCAFSLTTSFDAGTGLVRGAVQR